MTTTSPHRPVLALTMGDINGIGPEVLVKALARPEVWAACQPIVLGSVAVFERARTLAPACPPARRVKGVEEAVDAAGWVPVYEGECTVPALQPGVVDAAAARCVIAWITQATDWAMAGAVAGIVTCPIHKEGLAKAGCRHVGHTDLIADLTGGHDYRMCLFAENLRIVHITGHLSLRDALDAVKRERFVASVQIADGALRRMGFDRPRIAVAGLNPHAGEAGAFGREEIDEIAPAVAEARALGIECTGPYPPDTLFGRMRAGEFDLVIAMYHDQGHIPLKLIAMDEGVNVTLGIPVVRTSVDHGTAYDIAWQGRAREHSLVAAVTLAARLAELGEGATR
jgi:4-hydroxythreonine-4-phosphate dehydrogenase